MPNAALAFTPVGSVRVLPVPELNGADGFPYFW